MGRQEIFGEGYGLFEGRVGSAFAAESPLKKPAPFPKNLLPSHSLPENPLAFPPSHGKAKLGRSYGKAKLGP